MAQGKSSSRAGLPTGVQGEVYNGITTSTVELGE